MSFPICLQGRWGGRTIRRRGEATQAGAAIRHRRRAALEFLEDRTLLSIAPQTYVVTNTSDSGADTLRDAINSANRDTYPPSTYDTIQFDSSLAGKTISLTTIGDSTVGNSALAITAPVHIAGDAAGGLTIASSGARTSARIFYISAAGNLTLQNLTVSGGRRLRRRHLQQPRHGDAHQRHPLRKLGHRLRRRHLQQRRRGDAHQRHPLRKLGPRRRRHLQQPRHGDAHQRHPLRKLGRLLVHKSKYININKTAAAFTTTMAR